MPDISFEQKFGQLADAQLSERLPSLVEYRVGFQVLDQDEDENRAVGIAAFVVNNLWLYIPVFFLKGDLKGFDLLYIKQRDVFVPSLDNWVAALSQRGLAVLGKPVRPGEGQNDSMPFATPSNTRVYNTYGQLGKSASFDGNSLITADVWNAMCRKMGVEDAEQYRPVDLASDLLQLGKEAAATFLNTFLSDRDFASSLFRFYDIDQVERMAKGCAEKVAAVEAPPKTQVLFVTDMQSKEAAELDDSEKELLVRNGLYIRDSRSTEAFSKVFHEEVDSSILQSPTCPGIYDVLMADGSFRPYIILFPQDMSAASIMSRRFDRNVGRPIALIDIEHPKEYIRTTSPAIFCKPATGITEAAVKGLQGGREATQENLSKIDCYQDILLVQSPTKCVETSIHGRQRTPDGGFRVTIRHTAGYNNSNELKFSTDLPETTMEFTSPDANLQVTTSTLYVPEGCRFFTKMDRYRRSDDGESTDASPKQETPKIPSFGNSDTVHQLIYKQANLVHMNLHCDGGTAQIRFSDRDSGLITKEAALRALIFDHGVFAGQAQQMLADASRSATRQKGFFVKHAAPYDTWAYGESKRPFFGGPSAKEEYAVKEERQVKGGKPLTGPVDSQGASMLPDQAIRRAMQAAEAGVKEVFDVSVLEGLLDKADVSELRKDYLSDMIRGMDKVGRMLFLFYWHQADFEERYGKEDLQKLEDTLRDVFSSTGDLVLFLKEKIGYSPDAAEALFGNLSEDVAQ